MKHGRHLPALAFSVASARPQAGRARARTVALLVLASMLVTGCRTPWSIEPLPLEGLETGMHQDAVRHVLGEPAWTEYIHPKQTWHYEDEKVEPFGLTVVGLMLPLSLPYHLLETALGVDESERDCMWTEEREIDLYFYDGLLTEWVVTVKPERDSCKGDPNWQPSVPAFGPVFGGPSIDRRHHKKGHEHHHHGC